MPKATKKKIDYISQYKRENNKSLQVYLSKIYDADLIEVWESIPNKSAWLKEKLREEQQKIGKEERKIPADQ